MEISPARRTIAILAGLLGPGLGHAVLGRMYRGVVWALADFSFAIVSAHVPYMLFAWLLFHLLAPTVDLLRLKVPAESVPAAGKVLITCVLMLIGLVIARTAVRQYIVEAFKIPAESMVPTLAVGDHIFASKPAYRLAQPEHGDVVVFAYPCQPERDYVKRIVALGGDTVAIACNRLYVNSKPIPQQLVGAAYSYDAWHAGESWEQKTCARHRETIGVVTYGICLTPERQSDIAAFTAFPYPGVVPSCRNDMDADAAVREVLGRIEPVALESNDPCMPRWQYVVPADHVFTVGDNRDNSHDSRSWGSVPVSNIKGKVMNIWWSSGPEGIRWERLGTIKR